MEFIVKNALSRSLSSEFANVSSWCGIYFSDPSIERKTKLEEFKKIERIDLCWLTSESVTFHNRLIGEILQKLFDSNLSPIENSFVLRWFFGSDQRLDDDPVFETRLIDYVCRVLSNERLDEKDFREIKTGCQSRKPSLAPIHALIEKKRKVFEKIEKTFPSEHELLSFVQTSVEKMQSHLDSRGYRLLEFHQPDEMREIVNSVHQFAITASLSDRERLELMRKIDVLEYAKPAKEIHEMLIERLCERMFVWYPSVLNTLKKERHERSVAASDSFKLICFVRKIVEYCLFDQIDEVVKMADRCFSTDLLNRKQKLESLRKIDSINNGNLSSRAGALHQTLMARLHERVFDPSSSVSDNIDCLKWFFASDPRLDENPEFEKRLIEWIENVLETSDIDVARKIDWICKSNRSSTAKFRETIKKILADEKGINGRKMVEALVAERKDIEATEIGQLTEGSDKSESSQSPARDGQTWKEIFQRTEEGTQGEIIRLEMQKILTESLTDERIDKHQDPISMANDEKEKPIVPERKILEFGSEDKRVTVTFPAEFAEIVSRILEGAKTLLK